MIMPPTEYTTPANVGWLYEQGKDIEEVRHASWTYWTVSGLVE
jgi:hypothetical protein